MNRLAEDFDEDIEGDELNKLKVDEDVIFMNNVNFLYHERNSLLRFMLEHKLELFKS